MSPCKSFWGAVPEIQLCVPNSSAQGCTGCRLKGNLGGGRVLHRWGNAYLNTSGYFIITCNPLDCAKILLSLLSAFDNYLTARFTNSADETPSAPLSHSLTASDWPLCRGSGFPHSGLPLLPSKAWAHNESRWQEWDISRSHSGRLSCGEGVTLLSPDRCFLYI